ncbi:37S ribosomal protein S9, mitochondrial [Cryptotrichosporon argae]
MSASTSALRPLRDLAPLLRRQASTYAPSTTHVAAPSRRPRPPSPAFFTGKPLYHETLSSLQATLASTQASLRAAHIWPLPSALPHLHPPAVSWRAAGELAPVLGKATNAQHRALVAVLNELHHVRHVAATAGAGDVAHKLDALLAAYERGAGAGAGERAAKDEAGRTGIDELGRSYASGRRKESSARVWLVPSLDAAAHLDAVKPAGADADAALLFPDAAPADPSSTPAPPLPAAQILINHLPLAAHFSRVADREAVLRPFTLTGLVGAYNVFALVRGGGTTGQAGAVALGVARALAQIRGDVKDVLENDGALMRDTRMVERKKTGLAKARKRYTWVKR